MCIRDSIYPVAKGTIARIGWISGWGNAMYIYHNVNGVDYTTVYMHMSSFASGMYQGKAVTTDDVIGYVGNTGVSFGAHLHLGMASGCLLYTSSMNVGVINLLPFPAFDGGRVLFLIIEKIRRKPVPAKTEAMVNSIGFMLLMLLMVYVTFNDILRLF